MSLLPSDYIQVRIGKYQFYDIANDEEICSKHQQNDLKGISASLRTFNIVESRVRHQIAQKNILHSTKNVFTQINAGMTLEVYKKKYITIGENIICSCCTIINSKCIHFNIDLKRANVDIIKLATNARNNQYNRYK
jgi:hypothetical protein